MLVVVFSKSYCPYCKSTKNLLRSLDVDFKLVELDQECKHTEPPILLGMIGNLADTFEKQQPTAVLSKTPSRTFPASAPSPTSTFPRSTLAATLTSKASAAPASSRPFSPRPALSRRKRMKRHFLNIVFLSCPDEPGSQSWKLMVLVFQCKTIEAKPATFNRNYIDVKDLYS